jgi:hypothetical protein
MRKIVLRAAAMLAVVFIALGGTASAAQAESIEMCDAVFLVNFPIPYNCI